MTDARGELLALADYLDAGHNYLSDPEMIAKYKRWSAALRAAPVPQCEAEPVALSDAQLRDAAEAAKAAAARVIEDARLDPEALRKPYAAPARCDAERQRLDYDAQTGRRLEAAKAHQRFDAESGALGPCTQAELDAFEGLDDKSKQLLLMWMDRALKAEAAIVPPPSEAGREELIENAIREHFRSVGTSAVVSSDGIERVYYAGFSLKKLAETIARALSPDPGTVAVASADRECPGHGPDDFWCAVCGLGGAHSSTNGNTP